MNKLKVYYKHFFNICQALFQREKKQLAVSSIQFSVEIVIKGQQKIYCIFSVIEATPVKDNDKAASDRLPEEFLLSQNR